MLATTTIGYSETGIEKNGIKVAIEKGNFDAVIEVIHGNTEASLLLVPFEGTPIMVFEMSPVSETIVIEPVVFRNESLKAESKIRPPPADPL